MNEENWGLRKVSLSYRQEDNRLQQLVEFKADPSVIATLELNFRRERVIRFLTFRQDKYPQNMQLREEI